MAVIHKTNARKTYARGKIEVSIANHARPGLIENKHVTIAIPTDDGRKSMLVSFTRDEIDQINNVIEKFSNEVWEK